MGFSMFLRRKKNVVFALTWQWLIIPSNKQDSGKTRSGQRLQFANWKTTILNR